MEREISSAAWLAVSMLSLAAFIGIVIWTVSVGNNTKGQAIEFGSELAYNMESGEMLNLVSTCTDMSMAAAYNILTRNYNNITQIDIYRCTSADLASVMEDFEDKMESDSSKVAGTTLTKWRLNKDGLWSENGDSKSAKSVLMAYEVMMSEGMLSGRGYVTVNKLQSDTFRVKILYYNN